MNRWLPVLTIVLLQLALAIVALGLDLEPRAVCGSDADCARWEVLHRIPERDRCYGAPCPTGGAR